MVLYDKLSTPVDGWYSIYHKVPNCSWSSEGLTPTGPVFFSKLLLNGASHDTKIGCIPFLLAGGPLSYGETHAIRE